MKLQKLKDLWYLGKYHEVLNELKNQGKEDNPEAAILKALSISFVGSLHFAYDMAEQAYESVKLNKRKDTAFIAAITFGWIIIRHENSQKALDIVKEVELIFESLTEDERQVVEEWRGWLDIVKGIAIYGTTHNKKLSLKLLRRALEKSENIGHEWQKGFALFYLGWFYLVTKEYNVALETLHKSLEAFQNFGNLSWQGFCHNVIGNIYNQIDNVEYALDHAKKCINILEKQKVYCCANTASYWVWEYYHRSGQTDVALDYFKEKLSNFEDIQFDWGITSMCQRLATIHSVKGEWEKAQDYYQKKLKIEEVIAHSLDKTYTYVMIGNLYRDNGEFNRAFEYYDKCTKIAREFNRKDWIGETLRCYGMAYLWQGKLGLALQYLQQSLENFEEIGDMTSIAIVSGSIGDIYRTQGDFSEALKYYNKNIEIFNNIGINISAFKASNWSYTYHNIGTVYKDQGDLDEALNYYNKALHYFQKKANMLGIVSTLHQLISLMIEMKNLDLANKYLEDIKRITEKSSQPHIIQLKEISQALILKYSPRMAQKARAQDIFRDIIENPVIRHDYMVLAMLNLCDLLIAELKSFEEPEVLEEVIYVSKKLNKIAIDQHSNYLIVESLLLQSKLALLEFKLDQAQFLLQKAQETVTEKGLEYLSKKINHEQETLTQELIHWKNFAEQNVPMMERIKHADLEAYVAKASKIQTGLLSKSTSDQ